MIKIVIVDFLAAFAGIMTAGLLIVSIETLGDSIFPTADVNFNDPESLKTLMDHMPLAAKLCILLGCSPAPSRDPGWGRHLAARLPMLIGAIVGAFLLAMAIWSMLVIPHPVWFWIVSMVVSLTATCCGALLGSKQRGAPVP